MWISEPMPVMTRIITDDNGSSRSAKAAVKSPDAIHVKTGSTIARDSGGIPISFATSTSDTRNDNRIEPHATAPAAPLPMRRPKLALTRKPSSGRSGMRRSISGRAPAETRRAFSPRAPRSPCPRSPFERRKRFGVQRFLVPEQRDDDCQTDRGFSSRDGHDEEHDDLAVRGAERAAERDERQVDGVQHDLDRQQDRDQVAPHEHAGRPDGEQDGRQNQVVIQRHHQRVSRLASTTAPTIATRIRIDVTSNANA